MIDPGLRGRVALVTGGNHGIGAATSVALALQGCKVFVTYLSIPPSDAGSARRDAPGEGRYAAERARGAGETLEAIRASGGEAEAWEVDLADVEAAPRLFDRVQQVFGPVEVLVNNAAHWELDSFVPRGLGQLNELTGLWTSTDPPLVSAASHDRHFAVNSRAVALLTAEFARRHAARGATWGRIVNMSTGGASGFAGEVSYGASKHAMESYSRAAAAELGRLGITVNVVAPGPTQTGWITPELEDILVKATPAGRIGLPEDIADVIVFLASDQARWITGQLLYVGGGHMMGL